PGHGVRVHLDVEAGRQLDGVEGQRPGAGSPAASGGGQAEKHDAPPRTDQRHLSRAYHAPGIGSFRVCAGTRRPRRASLTSCRAGINVTIILASNLFWNKYEK